MVEVVLKAVKQDGRALQYASEPFRGDKEIVLTAVEQDGRALQYASEELQSNLEVRLVCARRGSVDHALGLVEHWNVASHNSNTRYFVHFRLFNERVVKFWSHRLYNE